MGGGCCSMMETPLGSHSHHPFPGLLCSPVAFSNHSWEASKALWREQVTCCPPDFVLRRHRHWLSILWPHPTHSYRQSHHMQWWGKSAQQRPKRATNDSENPGKQFRPNDGIKPCVFQPKDVKSTERSTLLFTLIIFFIAMTKHLSRTNSRKEGSLLAHNLKP